jgi:hypothetical protein
MTRKSSPAARMLITSYWPDGSVHLPEAELGHAPEGHRDDLRRRRRDRNLVETGDALEFDTYGPACAPVVDDGESLAGMRTRIRFVPVVSSFEDDAEYGAGWNEPPVNLS